MEPQVLPAIRAVIRGLGESKGASHAMAVSIEDVAQRANVSISTVSRVVNGRNIVNAATRKRVENAVRELGYRPNIFARGLMLQRSQILGFVLPDLHGEFYSEIIRGANLRARALGYHLIVSSVTRDDDGMSLLSSVGAQGMVDGVAVMVSELTACTREALTKISVPLTILDGSVEGIAHDTVMIDQRQGALMLSRHLVHGCGVRRMIFVGGNATNIDSMERLQACQHALAEAGMTLADEDIYYLDYEYKTAFDLGERHVEEWARGKACVFAANDEMAAGIVHAALSRGVAVPTNLRVAGFDDTRLARIMRPRLTTVHVPMQGMGATAVELLVDRLADPSRPTRTITLQSELMIRESCGAKPA